MFSKIKDFLSTQLSANTETIDEKTGIELSCAILMIDIALADTNFDQEERRLISDLLSNTFEIDQTTIDELILNAEKRLEQSVSLHNFTRLLNEELEQEDKISVIENLWRVAYADGVLDKYEEYYIRKIADLLYISHKDYIKTKHNAAE